MAQDFKQQQKNRSNRLRWFSPIPISWPYHTLVNFSIILLFAFVAQVFSAQNILKILQDAALRSCGFSLGLKKSWHIGSFFNLHEKLAWSNLKKHAWQRRCTGLLMPKSFSRRNGSHTLEVITVHCYRSIY